MKKYTLEHMIHKIVSKVGRLPDKMNYIAQHEKVRADVEALKKYIPKINKADREFVSLKLDCALKRLDAPGLENLACADLTILSKYDFYHSDLSEFKEKCDLLSYKISRLYS